MRVTKEESQIIKYYSLKFNLVVAAIKRISGERIYSGNLMSAIMCSIKALRRLVAFANCALQYALFKEVPSAL